MKITGFLRQEADVNMDPASRKFPLSTSFQFREDECAGFLSLLDRAFFDRPFSEEARRALLRTKCQLASGGKTVRGVPRGSAPSTETGALPATEAATPAAETFPGDQARHVLLYRGDSGIGKTHAFHNFLESAKERQIPVYEVYHHDVEGIPFKPFLRAIREILRDNDRGAVLQEKYRHGLQLLLPELYFAEADSCGDESPQESKVLADPVEWSAEGKVRIFDAITQLLLEITTEKPLLMLVHDLHWSDRPTIELLSYIGRNLALRNSRLAASARSRLSGENGFGESGRPGPEVEGFESEEWRSLSRKGAQRMDFLAPAVAALDERDDSAGGVGAVMGGSRADGSELEGLGVSRLMVLANYRGFPDASHYMEQAIRALGEESFTYHGELRALDREAAEQFIRKLAEGIHGDACPVPVAVEPETIQVIYDFSEGFPSFMHELFRALHLGEVPGTGDAASARVSSAAAMSSALAGLMPPSTGATSAVEGSSEAVSIPAERFAFGKRHTILQLRVMSASPEELVLLQAISVAMRPVTAALLCKVIGETAGEGERPLEPVLQALQALVDKGILERYESPFGGAGEGDDFYFFRLWDYVPVVQETILPDEKARLHQRIGEGRRSRLEFEGEEGAYEVCYHFLRGLDPRSAIPYGLCAAGFLLRSFALQKARSLYASLLEILQALEDLPLRVELLEKSAHISLALKESAAAEELLRKAQSDTKLPLSPDDRVKLILLEAEAARRADPARGLKILSRAHKLLKDENSRLGIQVQLANARMHLERQDLKRAINFALKGITLCQKVGDLPELGELHRVMASAFYRKGDYSYALDNYQRALDCFEKLGAREPLVRTLDELGRVYLERGNYFRAARYLYKCLETRRKDHNIVGLCKSYDELAQVYLRSGDYLKTIENLNRSLLIKERTGDFAGLNPTLVVLGDLYFRLGRYEQALAYFNREVENSQNLGNTSGLVEAFTQLGRVHLELGEVKQAETFVKQVMILASEFKLRSHEADGALLQGKLKAQARDWPAADKCFKLAAEVHGKLGHRRREACSYLDLADTRLMRDLFDECLKFASRAQLIADEVKALDLQVRALTLKGNIHRFLKGGNASKAREFFQKGLELSQGLSDVTTLFQLYYSLAKLCHSEREYAEAANYYGKAELILKQIGDGLSEERAIRFFEEKSRKVFAEDVARYRKEALVRTSTALADLKETATPRPGVKYRQVGFADYKDLLARVLRVHSELSGLRFHDRILTEAIELTGADRGFTLRVQNRQYLPVAFQGFGKSPAQDPEFVAASHLAQEAIRKGRPLLLSGDSEERSDRSEKQDKKAPLGPLVHRAVLAVPFMTEERIFGAIYLDKPIAVGRFVVRDQVLLENFAQHAAVALNNRREFETAIRDPLTGYYTFSYFNERLREAYRWFNLHGKSFILLGYYLPGLEEALGDGRNEVASSLTRDLNEALPRNAALCWGSPILYVLLSNLDLPVADALARRVCDSLSSLLGADVPMEILPVHGRFQHGSEILFELKNRLTPSPCDPKTVSELRMLLADDVSLREAKKILEKHKIESTLRKTGGNITHAARELGIHRPQLSSLLKKYDLRREVFETETETAEGGGAVDSSPAKN